MSVKRVFIFYSAFVFGFLCLGFTLVKEKLFSPDPLKLIRQMNDSTEKIKQMRFHLYAKEKIGKEYLEADSDIKLQLQPRKVYFKNPKKGIEILFREGEHNNQALVYPNMFPYTSIYLDPVGNLIRKNQHYTIHELGYRFIARTIKSILKKDPENTVKFMHYEGKQTRAGILCYVISYDNEKFSYQDYIVGKQENVSLLAGRNFLSDYMIREKNNLNGFYGYIKPGKVIRLPNSYCKKAVLYIDEKRSEEHTSELQSH